MGYLAQKKKSIREEMILKLLAIVLSIVSIIPLLWGDLLSVENTLFHAYCLIIIALIYSVFVRRFMYTLIFMVILLINYFYISSSSILFFAPQKQANNMVLVQYEDNIINVEDAKVLQKGFLRLDTSYAPFSKVNLWGMEQLFLGVDFSEAKDIKKTLKQLRNFIIQQDAPVIIVGDLASPAWSLLIKNFLDDTNLEVKNPLLFISSNNKSIFFSAPSYNILAFHNSTVSDVKIIKTQKDKTKIEFKYGLVAN